MTAESILSALNRMTGLAPVRAPRFTGADPLPAPYRLAEAAAASLSLSAGISAEIHRLRGGASQDIEADLTAAALSLIGFAFVTRDGVAVPRPADTNPTVGLYRTGSGQFIHLHGGFPHLAERTLALLNAANEAQSIAAAVRKWQAFALEDALAALGQCGAVVRSPAQWADSPQGAAMAGAPPIVLRRIGDAPRLTFEAGEAPLSDVRVLDLTRVLAGPVAGRTLASYGAQVLQIRKAALPTIELFDLETGLGKRAAALDLTRPAEAEALRHLARGAHVFIQSYRPGALARHGFSAAALAGLSPGIIHVSVNCYGHKGPWAGRPGWEQLAQAASGIAHDYGAFLARRKKSREASPALLPAAACDITTGYLAAAGAAAALLRRMREGGSWAVEVSLTATAQWLLNLGVRPDGEVAEGWDPRALAAPYLTRFACGPSEISALAPAVTMSATPVGWRCGPPLPGSSPPEWLGSM